MAHDSGLDDETLSGGTPDDDLPRQTIPEKVVPGERFMEKASPGRWDVYDWAHECCGCVRDDGTPDAACKYCGGSGNRDLVPEVAAFNLDEPDARLLVFGGELLAACEKLLYDYPDLAEILGKQGKRAAAILEMAARAVAKVKGKNP